MNSLNFKVVVMVLILAAAFLVASLFPPDSTADSYTLYLNITVVKCWDTSASIDVLCNTWLRTSQTTKNRDGHDPLEHSSSNTHLTLSGPENIYTNAGCYGGCSSSS